METRGSANGGRVQRSRVRPVRIVIFHPSDELYGADRVLISSAMALSRDGHDVRVVLPTDVVYPDHSLCHSLVERGIDVRHRAYPVLRRKYLRGRGVLDLLKITIASLGPTRAFTRQSDAVYLNTSATLLVSLMLLPRRQPVILHLHEFWEGGERRLLNWLAQVGVSKIIAVSTAITEPLSRRVSRRTMVVNNGFADRGGGGRRALGSDPLTILVASRWNVWKGHATLASAWGNGLGDNSLVICGGPPIAGQGVNVPGLFAEARNVTFAGEVMDISPYLDMADIVVVPSDSPDPLPTIAIEAMRAGCPVIGSKSGGLPEILGHNEEAGWLFEPRDAKALRDLILAQTQQTCWEKGLGARSRFLQLFSEDRFQRQIQGVFRDAARTRQRGIT